jgi:hypothetical protein
MRMCVMQHPRELVQLPVAKAVGLDRFCGDSASARPDRATDARPEFAHQ